MKHDLIFLGSHGAANFKHHIKLFKEKQTRMESSGRQIFFFWENKTKDEKISMGFF